MSFECHGGALESKRTFRGLGNEMGALGVKWKCHECVMGASEGSWECLGCSFMGVPWDTVMGDMGIPGRYHGIVMGMISCNLHRVPWERIFAVSCGCLVVSLGWLRSGMGGLEVP